MIFKRKIYSRLLDWKEKSNGSRALLIEGARRIGKSTIVEEFAKNEYKTYIIINFNECDEVVKNAFKTKIRKLDEFFSILSVEYGVTLYNRESIIIFDEIQMFPKAREAIKSLVKDGRFDYIETGSLISIQENVKDITIPSEESSIKMYPLDFEEFCWALGKESLCKYIKDCFNKKIPLIDEFHNDAMFMFKQYLLVGGMPQSLVDYLEHNRSFEFVDLRKRDIIDLYRKDIRKIKGAYKSKVISVFDQIPAFLSRHEKRIKISNIANGDMTKHSYEQTFFWLNDSMIVNQCFKCNDPNVGLPFNENRDAIKCYMNDTGLLFSMAFDENQIISEELYKQIMRDKFAINKGMLYENVISQMLVANGHKLYFYTNFNEDKHRNDIEIDFIITESNSVNSKIIPIEVKPSKNYSTISLHRFIEKYKTRIKCSYVIHPKNLKIEEGILYIPPYMTICL